MISRVLATFILIFSLYTISVFANEQYIDKTNHAVSGYDVVSYWAIKQSPVGQSQISPLPGKKSISTKYNGATWAFASEANRAEFLKNPEKYLPAYGGHCAYGAAQGYKVPANPKLWRIVDGKLYLNIRQSVFERWHKDIPGYIKKANKNWVSGLEKKPASKKAVPQLDIKKAPL